MEIKSSRAESSQVVIALVGGCVMVAAVVLTSWRDYSTIGSPGYWTWILTGLQVLALGAAASKQDWGWLLGSSVQLPWIAYALMTAQFGFIPGCAVSALVQLHGFLRRRSPRLPTQELTYA